MSAGCGASPATGHNDNTGTPAPSGQAGDTRIIPGRSVTTNGSAGLVRLGCGTYCQQAGGYGGTATHNMTKIETTQVTVMHDGTVAITVACLFRQPCLGALLVGPGDSSVGPACKTPAVAGSQFPWWGQSDLDIPARTTRTFGVTLSPCALGLLTQRGTLVAEVIADSSQTLAVLPPDAKQGLRPVDSELITVSAP